MADEAGSAHRESDDESGAALQQVVEATSGRVGEDFFHALTAELAAVLGVDHAFLARLRAGSTEELRVLSLTRKGERVEPFTYGIEGTPCERVFDEGVVVIRSGAADRFSGVDWFRDAGIEGYAAVRLLGGDGRPLGHLGVAHGAALPDGDGVERLLRAVSERARLELERLEAVTTLAERERQLRDAQAVARIGSWEWDLAADTITWSPQMYLLFGRSEDATLGFDDFLAAVHPDDAGAVREEVSSALAEGRDSSIEFRIRAGRGWRWMESRAQFERDAAGEVVLARGTSQDISDRKELEERLLQAQKLEAVGRLAGGLAHDFNNMLTGIQGFAQMALRGLPADHPVRGHLLEILAGGQRAAALTRQLLAFSRKQVLRPRDLDAGALVQEASRLLRRTIGEDVRLELEVPEEPLHVHVDSTQLEQVVMNLAVNARDAMPRGGVLSMDLDRVHLDPETAGRYPGCAPGGVRPGSGSATTASAWTRRPGPRPSSPSSRPSPRTRGRAWGSPPCSGSSARAGVGSASGSAPGEGSTFEICLPWVEAPGGEGDRRAGGPAVRRGSETVLVVEDEPIVRMLVTRMLAAEGYEVLQASSAAEASRVAEASGAVDLLLTDLVLPDECGPEVARVLGASNPDLRVLFMTGHSDHASLEHEAFDPEALIEKPFSIDTLVRRVRDRLDAAGRAAPLTAS